jgi:hypothetical protein
MPFYKRQGRHTNQGSSVNLGNPKRSNLLNVVSDGNPPLTYTIAAAILTYASSPELPATARSKTMTLIIIIQNQRYKLRSKS